MANICCDDVYFYSTDNPNGLNALWDDLNKAISFNDPMSNGWLGNWFAFKEIPTENIYLRGNIIDMDKNEHSVFIALSTAWTPLYEAYQIIAETYQIHFVLKSIEPGCGIYYNTDLTCDFFPDEYCVTYCNESYITPSGESLGQRVEIEECFSSEASLLQRFHDLGYSADSYQQLKLLTEDYEIWIHQFENPYN